MIPLPFACYCSPWDAQRRTTHIMVVVDMYSAALTISVGIGLELLSYPWVGMCCESCDVQCHHFTILPFSGATTTSSATKETTHYNGSKWAMVSSVGSDVRPDRSCILLFLFGSKHDAISRRVVLVRWGWFFLPRLDIPPCQSSC